MVLNKSSGTTFKRVVMFFMAIFVFSMVLVGCSSKNVENITLSKTDLVLVVGQTEKITVTVAPDDADIKTVAWSSEKPEVATVSADGLITAVSSGKIVITAKIGEIEAKLNLTVINPHSVTFHTEGGTSIAVQTVMDGEKASKPANPTKLGYVFGGWYKEQAANNAFDFNVAITANTNVYAKWVKKDYTITLVVNGGVEVDPVYANNGDRVKSPVATKVGHDLLGWYTDEKLEKEFNFNTQITSSFTLYAKWTLSTYVVKFDTKGGSAVADVSLLYLESVNKPADPVKAGYEFDKWYQDKDLKIAYDFETEIEGMTTIYAGWKPTKSLIVFNTDGGSEIGDVIIPTLDILVRPEDPIKDNYLFGGWYSDAAFKNLFDFDAPVLGPCTIYAKWNVDPLVFKNIEFEMNGGYFDITSTDPFFMVKPVSTFALNLYDGGYGTDSAAKNVFLMKNNKGGTTWADRVGLTRNAKGFFEVKEFIAASGNNPDVSKFDYILVGHGSYPAGNAWLKTLTVGQIVTVTGFNVAEVPADETAVTGLVKVYAAGTTPSMASAYLKVDSAPLLAAKAGHVFDGWYENAELTGDKVTKITKDQKLFAKWIVQYSATYNVDGGTKVDTQTITDGNKFTQPADPTKAGFVFDGWYSDAEFKNAFDFTADVKANVTLNAKWLPIIEANSDYKAVYNETTKTWNIEVKVAEVLDESAVKSITQTVAAGTKLAEPVAVTVGADTFLSFTVANEDKALTLKAAGIYQYEVVRKDDTVFVLEFNYNPERTMNVRDKMVVANVDYKAVWNNDLGTWYIEVVVPGKALDETSIKSITVIKKAGVDLETPVVLTPDTDTQLWFGVAKVDGDYAHAAEGRYVYEVVNQDDSKYQFEFYYDSKFVTGVIQTVTFESNGGSAVANVTYEKGTKVTKPADPTKDVNTFDGWFTDSALTKAFDFEAPATTDLTLYAKWKLTDYTITYNYNGGKLLFSTKTEMIDGFLADFYAFVKPTENLATFKHGEGKTTGYDGTWHSLHGAKIYDGPRPTKADDSKNLFIYSSLYQDKWLPFFDTVHAFIVKVNNTQFFFGAGTSVGLIRIRQYVINVKPSTSVTDETMAMMPSIYVAPATYTNATAATLPGPLKDGFVFGGWYNNAELTGDVVTGIAKGSKGNIELFARWLNIHKVKFDSQGGSTVAEQDVAHTKLAVQPVDPTKPGYIFDGWYVDADLSELYDFNTPLADGDLTLYAKWSGNPNSKTDYKATWNVELGQYLIDLTVPGEDAASVKSVKLIKKAGVALETPVALTVNPDTIVKFAVAKSDSDLTFAANGVYTYEVVRNDDTKYNFSFNYKSELVTGLTPVDVAKVNYKAVWNETRQTWYIEATAKESLDESTIKSFTDLRLAGEYVDPVTHEVNSDATFWFSVANKTGSNGLMESGVYSYLVTRQDDSTYVLTFTYDRTKVEGLPTVIAAEVKYDAVWNEERGTWYIEVVVPAEALDTSAVKEIDRVQEGGKYIAPVALTPDTDTVLWFGVAVLNGDLALKEAGDYTFAVLRQDDTRYLFTFTYVKESVKKVTHAVTFDVKGGSEVTAQVVEKNLLATKPATDPTRNGYTFGGWYKDAEFKTAFDFAAPITADTTILAKWNPIAYNLIANRNRGTYDRYLDKATMAKDFAKDYAVFAKKAIGATTFLADSYGTEPKNFFADPAFEAKWAWLKDAVIGIAKEAKYAAGSITNLEAGHAATWRSNLDALFNNKNNTSWPASMNFTDVKVQNMFTKYFAPANPLTYTADDKIVLFALTREGKIFGGWYESYKFAGDPMTVIEKGTTGEIRLYAKWISIHNVTFDVNGGSAVVTQNIVDGQKATAPADPTKAGYIFSGWFKEATFETAFDFDAVVNAPVTVYAKWVAEAVHTVTFNVDGGSAVAALQVDGGQKAAKPADPTKEGFVFSGWFKEATFATAFDFDAAVNAPVTAYAKWVEKPATVFETKTYDFSKAGGSSSTPFEKLSTWTYNGFDRYTFGGSAFRGDGHSLKTTESFGTISGKVDFTIKAGGNAGEQVLTVKALDSTGAVVETKTITCLAITSETTGLALADQKVTFDNAANNVTAFEIVMVTKAFNTILYKVIIGPAA